MDPLRTWKKVYENDLDNIVHEMKEVISTPAVILLSGPVGAGKTTFTKSFVGLSADVTSPTYSLINENGKTAHADFYRLQHPNELVHLELELYLEDKDYFLVEWGKSFLSDLKRFVSDEFLFYECEITVNEPSEANSFIASRNYFLHRLD